MELKKNEHVVGYVSNFIYLNTPFGPIEWQLQSKHEFLEGNFGYAAHTTMENKGMKRRKIPDPSNEKQVNQFKEYTSYVSPKAYHARLDDVEKDKVLIQEYSDYKNYRNIIGQVPKGSPQEKALISYFDKIYGIRDQIFDSAGQTYELIPYDIKKYLKSNEFKNIIEGKDENENVL